MVVINGKENSQVIDMTVSQYLKQAKYKPEYVAVECNGRIIKKADFDTVRIIDGDTVEIVSFVGGG